MTRITVDDQPFRQPRPEPVRVNLIDPREDQFLTGIERIEVTLEDLDAWVETERMDLGDLASPSSGTSGTRCSYPLGMNASDE